MGINQHYCPQKLQKTALTISRDQLCDGDIYRHIERNEPLLCAVNTETWLKC